MDPVAPNLRIAVVGAGIAGITAAYLLGKRHDVTLIEKNNYIGGHTNTIAVVDEPRRTLPIDTGFIVCNPDTYPLFYRLLHEWGVTLRDSDMSFGYFCEQTRLGYVGPSLLGLLRGYRNTLSPAFLRLLLERRRFNRRASSDLNRGLLDHLRLDAYLERVGATPYFVKHYLLPLAAAVWSSPDADMLQFPARAFLQFLQNHGMLAVGRRPQWQTVVGGSQAYVRAFRSQFRGTIIENAPAHSITRQPDGVSVHLRQRDPMTFDHVVMAAHADESLAMLTDANEAERDLLSAWSYHRNTAQLHTDASVMPSNRRLWASWNYRSTQGGTSRAPVSVTYHMNRLQGLRSKRDYFVSLNAVGQVRPASVIYSVDYAHPAYTSRGVEAQGGLQRLNGSRRTHFCGSYMGYGFHEDAVASAVAVAGKLGVSL